MRRHGFPLFSVANKRICKHYFASEPLSLVRVSTPTHRDRNIPPDVVAPALDELSSVKKYYGAEN